MNHYCPVCHHECARKGTPEAVQEAWRIVREARKRPADPETMTAISLLDYLILHNDE